MALNKELKEAYKEAGVTDEQIAKLEEVFTDEEILSKLTAQHMKAADYTTKTQALADARKALEAQQAQFSTDQDYIMQQTADYKTDMEKRLNSTLQELSQARLYGAALKTKVDTLAAQYGEDAAELLKDVQEMRADAKKPDAPAFDDTEFNKRYVPRDEFTTAANQVYSFAPMIRDFEREYQRTFGKEYEGSITELINESSRAVQDARNRGRKDIDLFGYMKEKLDFKGQQVRNQEAEKTKAAEERTQWETQKTEEIERNLRSKLLAENPNALRNDAVTFEREQWRDNLGANARQNKIPQQTPQDQFQHRQSLHQKFIENAEKAGAAA